MALSIRNTAVESLARELAEKSGTGITDEILVALKERKFKMEQETAQRLEKIRGLAAECGKLPRLDPRSPDEILGYDEIGGFDGR